MFLFLLAIQGGATVKLPVEALQHLKGDLPASDATSDPFGDIGVRPKDDGAAWLPDRREKVGLAVHDLISGGHEAKKLLVSMPEKSSGSHLVG